MFFLYTIYNIEIIVPATSKHCEKKILKKQKIEKKTKYLKRSMTQEDRIYNFT